jgi:glycosyltransferase involved in cell wall biosynthesis
MSKIWIIEIERLENRYSIEWADHIPKLLRSKGHDVTVISGPTNIPEATTPGAFLNFGGTNVQKSNQLEQISRMFCSGEIKSGDHFLFTDFWNPSVISVKYMSELLGIPVTLHALIHAGGYDPQDFLGRLIGTKEKWLSYAEQSMFFAYDHVYFATNFHKDLFLKAYPHKGEDIGPLRIIRCGHPYEYMEQILKPYQTIPKENIILFPHRIAPEKQVEIFRDLAKYIPEMKFIVCQDTPLTKHEYHTLLAKSKMVFSCALQETLGICNGSEGPLLGAIPLSPDRLSYSEIFKNHRDFLYPSVWTQDWKSYERNRKNLVERIRFLLSLYDRGITKDYIDNSYPKYFRSHGMMRFFK